ncbi:MAG TPA: class I SAM-dependent methyltransferase [Thermoanaerobaculia bacterium]|nr:class I SAM-dependent methyltransferase [Thermoanaerobaculia bacterium]
MGRLFRQPVSALLGRFRRRWPGGEGEPLFRSPGFAGWCNLCGKSTTFFCDDWPSARESVICLSCRSTSRYRSIAKGLLRAVAELRGVQASSVAELPGLAAPSRLALYDTQVPITAMLGAYPLPAILSEVPWIDLQMSVFKPSLAWGAAVAESVSNQNLEALTFPDAAFDVVITSDVMEHVRLAASAHREIRRVLRPGGVYLFTVPHDRGRATTLERVRIVDPADPARDELLMEPEYHGDANSPENRALAYRLYGLDLDGELQRLGFQVEYTREDDRRCGIFNTELFYCRVIGEPAS